MLRRVSSSPSSAAAFTLVELLVVLAIIALLMALLLPVAGRARVSAKITQAHADLRSITLALGMYQDDHRKQLPPTRFSCSSRAEYELPVELAEGRYLPGQAQAFGLVVRMPDAFDAEEMYRYRAPGAAIVNESTLIEDGANLWVPADFPACQSASGKYHSNPLTSPARYAVWSAGPDKMPAKLREAPGKAPLPARFWCRSSGDTGVITHYQDRRGQVHMSR